MHSVYKIFIMIALPTLRAANFDLSHFPSYVLVVGCKIIKYMSKEKSGALKLASLKLHL